MTQTETEKTADCLKFPLKTIKYDLIHNVISYQWPLSLEYITVTRIAISLWQRCDIVDKIVHAFNSHNSVLQSKLGFGLADYDPLPTADVLSRIESEVISAAPYIPLLRTRFRKPVEERARAIGKEIFRFISSLSNFGLTSYDVKNVYIDEIRWTYQGTIDYIRTAEALIDSTGLSIKDKYSIACTNCLESRIREMHENIYELEGFINDQISSRKQFRLLFYWTRLLTDNTEEFIKSLGELCESTWTTDGYHEFQPAIFEDSKVAVQYLWQNFSEEARKGKSQIVGVLMQYPQTVPIDILVYLMLQIEEKQFNVLNSFNVCDLLGKLLHDDKWYPIFLPVAQKFLHNFSSLNLWNAIKILLYWRESVFEEGQILRYCTDLVNKYEDEVRSSPLFLFQHFQALLGKDEEIIKLFLRGMNNEAKAEFMKQTTLRDGGAYYCSLLAIEGKLDLVNLIIQEMLPDEESIQEFKTFFFRSRGVEVCDYLIVRGKYEIVDNFLAMFVALEEINSLKQDLALMQDPCIISRVRHYSECTDGDANVNVDRFLSWCFRGNEREISNYKTKHRLDFLVKKRKDFEVALFWEGNEDLY